MNIIERLKFVEDAEREVSLSMDMRPEDTANYHYAETCHHAAKEIERLREALTDVCGVGGDPEVMLRVAADALRHKS